MIFVDLISIMKTKGRRLQKWMTSSFFFFCYKGLYPNSYMWSLFHTSALCLVLLGIPFARKHLAPRSSWMYFPLINSLSSSPQFVTILTEKGVSVPSHYATKPPLSFLLNTSWILPSMSNFYSACDGAIYNRIFFCHSTGRRARHPHFGCFHSQMLGLFRRVFHLQKASGWPYHCTAHLAFQCDWNLVA